MHSAPERRAFTAVNLLELEAAARETLELQFADYFAAGANDELTLAANISDYRRLQLAPRVLVDVTNRDHGTTLLGRKMELPVLVAPMAFQRLAHAEGELATARACSSRNFGMILSTFSTSSIAEVRASTAGPALAASSVASTRIPERAASSSRCGDSATARPPSVASPRRTALRMSLINGFDELVMFTRRLETRSRRQTEAGTLCVHYDWGQRLCARLLARWLPVATSRASDD